MNLILLRFDVSNMARKIVRKTAAIWDNDRMVAKVLTSYSRRVVSLIPFPKTVVITNDNQSTKKNKCRSWTRSTWKVGNDHDQPLVALLQGVFNFVVLNRK